MKIRYYHILLIFGFLSCEKQWDDPIPEGAILGTPNLTANLTEEGKVMLNWDFSRFCPGWMCIDWVEGSRYEIFGKYPGTNDFIRISRLGADEKAFLVENLEFGKPYEFYLTTHRAGQKTTSNRVMIIPNPFPEFQTLMESDDWDPIFNPKINPNGDKIAYISNYRWSEGDQNFMTLSLYLLDLFSGQTELIKLNSHHPQWSADGKKIVFGTDDGLSQIAQGYKPTRLEIFDINSKESTVISSGQYQQYFPSFERGNAAVIFLSDSLERGNMGLWRTESNGTTKVLWPSFQLPEQGVGLPLFTGMDGSVFKDIVAVDNIRVVENRPIYNIYGLEYGSGIQKKDLVISQWNDMAPAFSTFDERLLSFISDRSGSRQIWTLDITNGKLNQISYFKNDENFVSSSTSLSWTDQGKAIVFSIYSVGGIQKVVKISVPDF